MKLFLSSIFEEVAPVFRRRFRPDFGMRVTFIPTAANVEDEATWIHSGRKALQQLGLDVRDLDIATASPEEIQEKLESCDILYVAGGNTFFLLQELKRTGADEIIKRLVQEGVIYIGESAGTAILAPSIEYVKGMDDPAAAEKLESFEALGLVDFYPLPHYECEPYAEKSRELVERYSEEMEFVAFGNDECVSVIGSKIRLDKEKNKR